jgi:hypothetical protein
VNLHRTARIALIALLVTSAAAFAARSTRGGGPLGAQPVAGVLPGRASSPGSSAARLAPGLAARLALARELAQLEQRGVLGALELASAAFPGGSVAGSGPVEIVLDEIDAPPLFVDTAALQGDYLGLAFFRAPPLDGGAILNELSGFGIEARSDPNFLAFNRDAEYLSGGLAKTPHAVFVGAGRRRITLHLSIGNLGRETVAVLPFGPSGHGSLVVEHMGPSEWREVVLEGDDLGGFLLLGNPVYLLVDDVRVE